MVELNSLLRQGRIVWRTKMRDRGVQWSNERVRAKVRECAEEWPSLDFVDRQNRMQELINETELTPQKLKKMIAYMRERRGTVTKDKRAYIQKYMQQREGHWNANDVIILASKLKLSRQQVRQQRLLILDPSGEITPIKRDIVKQWARSHKYLASKQLDALQEETQLSRLQIRNLFHQFRTDAGPISEANKNRVKQLIQQKRQELTREDIFSLSEELSIPEDQLSRYIRYHEHKTRPLTNSKKLKLVNWFHANDFRDPTARDVESLTQLLDLSPFQVRSLVQRLLVQVDKD
eukprot:CAMPEP_0117445310 /NCGR_PEP_ID=MMETSP0759-20121206/5724_1 /TAXON_ID=63605 /ORGANISM="Percolomonas cosmopolitus, Strain WS" /LENGTH=290 /DNA_ID=CAMNT_0005237471 /DNA_START=346 /DNA_END=1218 /DNA_ORIENTATION=-